MRILHTTATYAPSLDGVAEVVRNISERLARNHEVHVATSAVGSGTSHTKLHGVHVHRFPASGNLAFGLSGQIEEYRKFVRFYDWDLLVNHCLQVWTTDALLTEIGAYPWPSVLVTHGAAVDNPDFRKYYAEIPQYLPVYSRWMRVSNSPEEFSFAKKLNLSIPPVITNGVDMNEWTRPPLGLRQRWGIGQRPWVVNVSNHSPLKGHRDFFRLASLLRCCGAHMTLIGGAYPMSKWALGRFGISGGCVYRCRVRAQLSIGKVEMRTNVPRGQVVSALQEADVLVSTSHLEANSIVLLESMAVGTPWVSFDVGSAHENVGGVVAGDLKEMAEVIVELLRDADRRNALGCAGRARAKEKHDWESITKQYEELYESVVRNHVQPCPC